MTPARRSALLVVASAVACFAASAVTSGDPLFLLEGAAAIIVAGWAVFALVLIGRSAVLARKLAGGSVPRRISGVGCRIVQDSQPHAFVAGVLVPSVFLTTGALEVLTPDEVHAVVLHEAHHARTLAPVRAALVDAWGGAGRRVPRFGGMLAARLAAIEIDADRFALAGGVTRRHLASALVKLDPSPGGAGFDGGGDGRLRVLIDEEARPAPIAPVEWLPLLVVVALAAGCRLAGTAVGV